MRFGKLLAQGDPNDLLEKYDHFGPTLEDVFLGLCMQDGDLETSKVREERKIRSPIVKEGKEKADMSTSQSDDPLIAKMDKINGVQIVSNGSAKHNNNIKP